MIYRAIKSCWGCGSSEVIKWGTQGGRQRYRCKHCGLPFQWQNKEVAVANRFVWFRKWVMERQVYRTLVRDSGRSQSSLQRLFRTHLDGAPELSIKAALKERTHLLIDGSYFPGNLCIVLYMDHTLGYVQRYRDSDGERYSKIYEDLMNLRALGVAVYSVTCDGHRSILKAVRKAFPEAIIQRCVVHTKRQVKTYLSTRPQSDAGKELLQISRRLTGIKTHEQSALWLLEMQL